MYPLGEYQFITSNVLAEYICQKTRAFVNCIRRVSNSEELPQTQTEEIKTEAWDDIQPRVRRQGISQREEIEDEGQPQTSTPDPSPPYPFPWFNRFPNKKDARSLDISDISLEERRSRFANSRNHMSSQSSLKYHINDSIFGKNHRSIRQSVCEFFREEEAAKSIKILSGKCGDVRIDSNNSMVYKCFKPLAEVELPDEEKEGLDIDQMAEEETKLFNLYYGAGSAEKYTENNRIWVKMKKIQGTDLERLEDDFDKVIEGNVRPFYTMLSRLFSLGICHGDFLLKNILFHDENFYPIDFCQSSWDQMEDNLSLIASLTGFIQSKDENITLSYELKEGCYHVALVYQNKLAPEKNEKEIFILQSPADSEKYEIARL